MLLENLPYPYDGHSRDHDWAAESATEALRLCGDLSHQAGG